MIVVDSREPESNGWPTEELSCGDFVIEGQRGKILIERKEWTDFVGAYRSGTLFNQLGRCLEQEHDVFLVLEGDRKNAYNYANAREKELRRVLTSLYVKFPIKIIETDSLEHTLKIVSDFDDWLGQDPDETYHSIRPTEKVPPGDRPRYMVEGLPNVGPKLAERLLDHFGTPIDVFSASAEELREVEGIGLKKSERIVEALTTA